MDILDTRHDGIGLDVMNVKEDDVRVIESRELKEERDGEHLEGIRRWQCF